MKLQLKRIRIENFKKLVAPVSYEFVDGLNVFEGENGLGKSTILSAITWCMFGYTIYGKSVGHFGIYPVIDNEEKTDLKPTVELELDFGGVKDNIVLKRVFAKNKTQCMIGSYDGAGKLNFVKYTNREFDKHVEEQVINKTEFEMLSNIEKIPRLKESELKELIFSLVGELEDSVILANDDYHLIETDIRLHGVDKSESNYKQTRTSFKKEIEDATAVINHNITTKEGHLQDQSEEALNERKAYLDEQVAEYEKEVTKNEDAKEKIAKHNKQVSDIDSEINSITIKMNQAGENVVTYKQLYTENAFDAEKERKADLAKIDTKENNLRNDISTKEFQKGNIQRRINQNQESWDKLHQKNVDLKDDGMKIQNENISIKEKCSACGQPLTEEQKAEAKSLAKKDQINRMSSIKSQMDNNKTSKNNIQTKIDEDKELINGIDKEIADINEKIKALDVEREEIRNKEYLSQKETPKQIDYRETYERYQNDYKQFEEDIKAKKDDKTKLEEEELPVLNELNTPTELIKEKEDIAIKLAAIKTCDVVIDEKTKLIDNRTEELLVIDEKIQMIIKFKTSKSQLITERIQSHFNMVEFITSEKKADGDIAEVFKLAYNGVEYNDLSVGEKIKISFDLVTGIQNLKGMNLPILIDVLESVTDFDYIPTQVIAGRVVPGVHNINFVTELKNVTMNTQPKEEVEVKTEDVPVEDSKEPTEEAYDAEQGSFDFEDMEA